MHYVVIARLVMLGLTMLIDLIQEIKKGQPDTDALVDKGSSILTKIGTIGGVKELNETDLKALLPEAKAFVRKLIDLRKEVAGEGWEGLPK